MGEAWQALDADPYRAAQHGLHSTVGGRRARPVDAASRQDYLQVVRQRTHRYHHRCLEAGVPDEEQCSWTGTTTFLTVDIPPQQESEVRSEDGTPEHARQRLVDMSSARPWDGDEPPMPINDDPASFIRRDDSIWCRKDVRGRLYHVNGIGQLCAKPKASEKSKCHYSDQKRPTEVSPHVWWNMLTKAERLQWCVGHPGGAPAVSMKCDFTCNPIGISSLVSKAAGSLVQTCHRYFHLSVSAMDMGCRNEGESDDDSVISEREEMPLPWDDWEKCGRVG